MKKMIVSVVYQDKLYVSDLFYGLTYYRNHAMVLLKDEADFIIMQYKNIAIPPYEIILESESI